jgi:RNA polymerase sigma factor (sigma-70 family)
MAVMLSWKKSGATQHFGAAKRYTSVRMVSSRSFDEWYRETYPRLATAMLASTGDSDVAADATDEAFARAWLHWNKVQSMHSPAGWTYRVALNVARSRRRRRRIEEKLLPRLVRPSTTVSATGEVWELVRELPPRQRTAIVLRYVADLSEHQIADAMGVSRGTVSSTLSDARRHLGDVLREPTDAQEQHEPI